MEQEDRLSDVFAVQGPRALDGAAATVVASKPDAEAELIGQQQWEAIQVRRAEGMSVSAIAREFDLDRKTVRACLREPAWSPYRREVPAESLLDAHRAWLEQRAAEVNHSARIVYQELRSQRRFTGSYEIVKRAVRPLRAAALAALTQCRFETAPGEQAQCDWGQITVRLGGVRSELHVFVMTPRCLA